MMMSTQRGTKKKERGYTTVVAEDGVNYREIAETMTELGFTMNHSSARNHVLRVMRKFVNAISREWDVELNEKSIDEISKDPAFQHGIADLLQAIEERRRSRTKAQ